jgi:hypothetical protein
MSYTFTRDWAEEYATYSSDLEIISGNFQSRVEDGDETVLDSFDAVYESYLELITSLPETDSKEGQYKADAYDALYNGTIDDLVPSLSGDGAFAGNWASWYVDTTEDLTLPDGQIAEAGQTVLWHGGLWYIFDAADVPVNEERKYLQALITRFFGPEIFDNYPDFADLCLEFLKYLDSAELPDGTVGAYYLSQQLNRFFDIDRAPTFALQGILLESAMPFGADDAFYGIPYFVQTDDEGTETPDYDSIRNFARIARRWTHEKGSLASLFVLFRMLLSNLRVRLAWKQVLRMSSYNDEHEASYDNNNNLTYTAAESPFNYAGMREGDTDTGLITHAHGVESNIQTLPSGKQIRKDTNGTVLKTYENDATWSMYALVFDTDADIQKYWEMVELLWKPGGVPITWRDRTFSLVGTFGVTPFGEGSFGGL